MDKLIWVLLPLLAAAAAVAWWAWRRGPPTRLALNVGSSVLLLVYLLTTAGLGIFWVANQHLPVFDWHYVFGYATVLLLAVHLVFNFRIVWRYLSQRLAAHKAPAAALAAAAGAGAAPAFAPRRQALGGLSLLGAAAAAGLGFAFGLRQGRTELHVSAGPTSGPAAAATRAASGAATADTGLAVVEQFHEFSAHSRAGVFRRAPGADWGAVPPPFKAYPQALQVALPPADTARTAPPGLLDVDALSRLLWASAGVNQVSAGIHFRTSPSSGALFATELYLLARQVPGLDAGWWHYDGRDHRLQRLRALSAAEASEASEASEAAWPRPAAELVATAIFRRSGHKYRDRTYRYVLGDLGHLLENTRASAAALGLQWRPLRLFDESMLARTLGLDEAEEGVLACVHLQGRAAAAESRRPADAARTGEAAAADAAAFAGQAPDWPAAGPARWTAPPWPQRTVLGVTDAIHRATSLRSATVAEPTEAPAPSPTRAASAALPPQGLPPPRRVLHDERVLALIARRRSIRRYRDEPVPLATLGALLHEMVQRPGAVYSDAVRVDLVSHAVQGLPSTAWRYDAQQHALQRRRGDTLERSAARRAALDQDVIGDAAVVFVLSIDRSALARDDGGAARGYRHAFIESGLVGERLYLAAAALGLGVCAVGAFYDDEASRLIAVDPAHEWVVHFAALGVPG